MLIDAHVHLQEELLEGRVEEAIDTARAEGVGLFVSNGTHAGDWERTLWLAEQYHDVAPCLGLHPWFVAEQPTDWLERLRDLVQRTPVAIGEIGIDAFVKNVDMALQEEAFVQQVKLAHESGLPVMIHCVRAFGRLLELLEEVGPPPAGFLLHGYGGSTEVMVPLARMGAYFSFNGNPLRERNTRARAALLAAPPDRLLIETDAPAMPPPEEFRPYAIKDEDGREWNHPGNLAAICSGLASLLGMDASELAKLTSANARRLLGDIIE